MPDLNNDQIKVIEHLIPCSLNISKEQALKECDDYIKTGNKNINDISPLSVYYIISKLKEENQIVFLKENIKYIKKRLVNIKKL